MKPNELLSFFRLQRASRTLLDKDALVAPYVVFDIDAGDDEYGWRFEIEFGASSKIGTRTVRYYVRDGLEYTEYAPESAAAADRVFDESLREPRVQWTETSSPIADQVLLRSLFVNGDDSVSVHEILFNRLNSPNYTQTEKKALLATAGVAAAKKRKPLDRPPTNALVTGRIVERMCPPLMIPLDAKSVFSTDADKDASTDWYRPLVGQVYAKQRAVNSATFEKLRKNAVVRNIADQLIINAVFAVLEHSNVKADLEYLKNGSPFIETLCKLCFPYGNVKNYNDALTREYQRTIDAVYTAASDALDDENTDVERCIAKMTYVDVDTLDDRVAHLAFAVAGSPPDNDLGSLVLPSQAEAAARVFIDTLRKRTGDDDVGATWESVVEATARWKNLVIYDPVTKKTYTPPSARGAAEPHRYLYLFYKRTKLGTKTDPVDFYLPKLLFEKAVRLSV